MGSDAALVEELNWHKSEFFTLNGSSSSNNCFTYIEGLFYVCVLCLHPSKRVKVAVRESESPQLKFAKLLRRLFCTVTFVCHLLCTAFQGTGLRSLSANSVSLCVRNKLVRTIAQAAVHTFVC